MDKIDHTTKDILGGNIEKIAKLFPSVVTEAQDEATGELKKVIDFDLLRQHLSDTLVEGDRERFRLDWPGKKASILKANTPISKTLRPVREDSVDFDTTQNVFIEGDNFEVLKVLQESYLGKIKMIYIDPPYNTGKDFIYRDNFAQDREDYEEEIGVRDDENGGKLVKNTETNGRYHSDWLSMMQERLIVARDLLTDDGVIFISIDDNEQANLKMLCDEIFGNNTHIGTLAWLKKRKGSFLSKKVISTHEYCLIYGKQGDVTLFGGRADSTESQPLVKRTNATSILQFPAGVVATKLSDGIYEPGSYGEGSSSVKLLNKVTVSDGFIHDSFSLEGPFIWSQQYLNAQLEKSGRVVINTMNFQPRGFKYDDGSGYKGLSSIVNGLEIKGTNEDAYEEGKALFGSEGIMDYPKPINYIRKLISSATEFSKDAIILDFFSGSGTTAHAVMQLNAEDGGNRKHIQVQLAEPTDPSSEAYKAGYKSIPEISRERIRRAGKKIREDYAEQIAKRDTPLDTGFRAYKLSSSNFINTAQHPDETTQASLLETANNIKGDRTAEDLLTETILDLGLTLDLPVEVRSIAGHTVYFVSENSLAACFDDNVTLDIAEPLAAEKPLRVVFKDSSFASDEVRVNIDIRLKQLSPETEIKVL